VDFPAQVEAAEELASAERVQDDGAGGEERAAENGFRSDRFTEKGGGEHEHEYNAEFVDGGDRGGFAELEGAEVAEPGESGGEAGEREEEECATREGEGGGVGGCQWDDDPREEDDDGGADGGGEIRVDTGDADLREDRGGGGEDGGEEGPREPVHGSVKSARRGEGNRG
jgi:hypothetical protein